MIAPVLNVSELLLDAGVVPVDGVGPGLPVLLELLDVPLPVEDEDDDGCTSHLVPEYPVGQLHTPDPGVPPFKHWFWTQNCPLWGKGHVQLVWSGGFLGNPPF